MTDTADTNTSAPAGADSDAPTFEDALAELEDLVTAMEEGDLDLNASLKAFERGVRLARHCQTALQEAELKVRMLTEDGDLTDLDMAPE